MWFFVALLLIFATVPWLFPGAGFIYLFIFMVNLLKTDIGRLRIIGFLEGITLLILVFIAVPMKYYWNNPIVSKTVGPVHGALFLLFVLYVIIVGAAQNWRFKKTTWKVLIASFIPFGNFYIDKQILSRIQIKKPLSP